LRPSRWGLLKHPAAILAAGCSALLIVAATVYVVVVRDDSTAPPLTTSTAGDTTDPPGSTTAVVSPTDPLALLLTTTDVGLSSSDWAPEPSCSPGDTSDDGSITTSWDTGLVSCAVAGNTSSLEIDEEVYIYDSEASARAAFDAIISSMPGRGYEPAGAIPVEFGEATTFLDTTDDGIEHIVGIIGTVVWDVAFYGPYDPGQLASTASLRASGTDPAG